MLAKNFSRKELECPCGCGFIPEQRSIEHLQHLRNVLGIPLVINSGARCAKYNATLAGSVPDSQHVQGIAFDVRCTNAKTKHKIIALATSLHWSVGIYENFVHIDRRKVPVVFRGRY